MRRGIATTALVAITALASFLLGSEFTRRAENIKTIDQLLLDVSSDLLVRDQLLGNQPQSAMPLLDTRIENKFAAIVQSDVAYRHEFDGTRCAITRRLRKLREQGHLLADVTKMAESGIDAKGVASYFESQCPGEPSKTDWTKATS